MKYLSFFDNKTSKTSLAITIIVGLVTYNLYFVNGLTNPDGIIEGLTSFINAGWVIQGCGRWLLAILTYLSGNVVMPFASIIGYCVCVWLSSLLISRIWKQDSFVFIIVCPIIMIVSPAVVTHFSYNAVAFPYSLAMLLSTIYVYLCFEKNGFMSYFFGVFCIVCSLGIYQNYIGYAACLVLMAIAIKLIKKEAIKDILKKVIISFVIAIIGSVLYAIVLKLILLILNMQSSSRIANISLSFITNNLLANIKTTYTSYFNYFNDSVLFRKYIFICIFAILAIVLIASTINHPLIDSFIIVVSILLIPLASNIVLLIIPDQTATTCMSYQYMLIVPFTLAIAINLNKSIFVNYVAIIITLILSWTYVISANATYSCYKLSYNYINNQMSQVTYDIEHNENYILDETPVIVGGFIDDDTLRNNIKTYKYAIDLPENVAFWKQQVGVTYNRQKYFMNFFGIDFKDIDYSEYLKIINSNEYTNMPIWPKDGSITKIDKYLVVKLDNSPVKD